MWIWKKNCFHTNNQNFVVHSYQFEPHEKKLKMHKIKSRRTFILWVKLFLSYQTWTLLKIIPLLFSSKMNLIYFTIYMYIVVYILRVTCVFQFFRVYGRINSINALIMLRSSTSNLIRELTIHDNLYILSMKKRVTFAAASTSGYTSVCNLRIRIYR